MGRLTGIPTASVGFFDGSTDLSGGGGTLAPQDVVEFYLQPVSLGTTNYSSDFEMDSSDNISVNNVTTSDASGTIYFDVYAGLNLSGGASSGGVETAELNFTSTGAIGDGSTPSSLGLAFANGFGDGPAASTGDSTDLNDDGNLDLGSTGNANPAGWADFCQNPGVIGTASGSGSGDCTNVLLGVLAYNYSDAGDGQTAQVTLDSRTGTFAPVFMYELDGVFKTDTFNGSKASDLAIGTPVTITYAPAGGQDASPGVSQVSSAARGLSQVSFDETGTVPLVSPAAAVAVPDVSPPLGTSGTVSIVVNGFGTLILSGDNNTYSGGTDVESGTLQARAAGAISPNSNVTIGDEGTLDLGGFSLTLMRPFGHGDGGHVGGHAHAYGRLRRRQQRVRRRDPEFRRHDIAGQDRGGHVHPCRLQQLQRPDGNYRRRAPGRGGVRPEPLVRRDGRPVRHARPERF